MLTLERQEPLQIESKGADERRAPKSADHHTVCEAGNGEDERRTARGRTVTNSRAPRAQRAQPQASPESTSLGSRRKCRLRGRERGSRRGGPGGARGGGAWGGGGGAG